MTNVQDISVVNNEYRGSYDVVNQPLMLEVTSQQGYMAVRYTCGVILHSDCLKIPATCACCGQGTDHVWVYTYDKKGNPIKMRTIKVV